MLRYDRLSPAPGPSEEGTVASESAVKPMPRAGRPPRMRLLVMLLVLVVVSSASIFLGTRISNPRQLEATAHPPQIGLLTTAVRRQVVSQTVTFSASPGGGDLSVPAVGQGEGSLLVVTGLAAHAGQRVRLGRTLAVISGRPIIVLHGNLPAYRDLAPGMVGPDVTQLRASLADIGLSTSGDLPSRFGPNTQSAVATLYARLGFEPSLTSPTALSDRAKAVHSLASAETALSHANSHGVKAEISAARTARDQARDSLATLDSTSGVTLPRAEIFYVPSAHPKIASVKVRVGQEVNSGAPLMSLSVGASTLIGTVDPNVASDLAPGLHGRAKDEETGATWLVTTVPMPDTGPVAADPSSSSTNKDGPAAPGTSDSGNVALVLPNDVNPARLSSQLTVDVTLRRTRNAVLAVPATAITSSTDGRTWIELAPASGATRRVEVSVGLSGGGYVQVSSADTSLVEGARVVVGQSGSVGSAS
jgi:hypothetical protein